MTATKTREAEKPTKIVGVVAPEKENPQPIDEDIEEDFTPEQEELAEEWTDEEDSCRSLTPSPNEATTASKKKSGDAVAVKGISMQLIAAFIGVGLAASAVASYFLVANTYHEKIPAQYLRQRNQD